MALRDVRGGGAGERSGRKPLDAAAGARRTPFPWREVMGTAFGLLRLSPAAFWAMTPLEFNAALEALGLARGQAPGRTELYRLMRLFPDNQEKWDGG
ncbi:phage tail assembly chaperone [Chelativorans xinjiangense]|uniref:phage tail assembly chaperone n=1 Tax=Chelativorans xinjiangense TaxID=2681485 RepID=UPI0024836745|nr:phage tail assembly chaperone [Chelativorans xinjiangense]